MACPASLPPMYEVPCLSRCYYPVLNLRIGSLSPFCVNSSPSPSDYISLFLKSSLSASSSSSDSCSAFDDCSFSVIKNYWSNKQFESHAMSIALGDASLMDSPNSEIEPDHLLVLVHGIMGSPSDWTYCEAELKRRLGKRYMIYASSSNTYTKTFAGVDGAGRRLADEVMEVVKKNESLKKISFLSHSLGGLFSRYAIAVLYSADKVDDDDPYDPSNADQCADHGTIAGLEAISFVTLATPHLGVRGRKQLPFLFGVSILEKLAPPLAPFLVGQTGSQLFLTDGNPEKPPLLLRMASDCKTMKFLSALGAFRSRVLYATISYDHMVGWRTSSIRREGELPKTSLQSLEGYDHVVNVEDCPPLSSTGPNFSSQAADAKEAAQSAPCTENTAEYHEILEEEMICGLQRLGWKKVDVSFHLATWPFFAHNSIQVKNERLHNAGAGVVSHVADILKLQETSSPFIAASLQQ